LGGGKVWTVGEVAGLELLALPEPLESSPGEVAGPGRLVLSTFAMIMYRIGKTPITSTIESKIHPPQGDWKRTTDGTAMIAVLGRARCSSRGSKLSE